LTLSVTDQDGLTANRIVSVVVNPVFVVDNGGPGYSETGSWLNSGLTGYNNTSTRYSVAANAAVTWNGPAVAGYYQVSLYKVVHPVSATSAKLSIAHNGAATL
jgi:mannan endo-1,4-beta-mannosidase